MTHTRSAISALATLAALCLAGVTASGAAAAPAPSSAPAASADDRAAPSGKILYLSNRNLWTVDVRTSVTRKLTRTNDVIGGAEFSPDGTKVAFGRDVSGNADVFTMRSDGTGMRRITTWGSREWAPTWSPDGKQLAFLTNRFGPHAIFRTVAAKPGIPVRVTPANPCGSPGLDWGFKAPTWSPTSMGEILTVHTCEAAETGYLWPVIERRTPSGARLPGYVYDMDADAPAWFPNGRDFAFQGSSMDAFESGYPPCIGRGVKGRGGGQTYLTRCFADEVYDYAQSPAVSPDGKVIAYTSMQRFIAFMSPTGAYVPGAPDVGYADALVMDWAR